MGEDTLHLLNVPWRSNKPFWGPSGSLQAGRSAETDIRREAQRRRILRENHDRERYLAGAAVKEAKEWHLLSGRPCLRGVALLPRDVRCQAQQGARP